MSTRQSDSVGPGFFIDDPSDTRSRVPEDGWARELNFVGPGVFEEEDTSSLTGVTTWRSRSVSTKLTCDEPGCEATAQLEVFTEGEETVRDCKFTLDVHPTDFDDRYSGERVEWVQVNGAVVNEDCFPMVSACNESTQAHSFTCVRDLDLYSIINKTGILTVQAKIPSVVDECPYEGNYLSAVSTVTCLVTPTYTTTTTTLAPNWPLNLTVHAVHPKFVYRRSPLRCLHRNCTAHTTIDTKQNWMEMGWNAPDSNVNSVKMEETRANYSKCLLNVMFFQTDFDQDDGTEERIEYISVAGKVRKTNVSPGENPCKVQWQTGVRPQTELYLAIQDLDVTEQVSNTRNLVVEAKITPWVDECSYEGYLLNGFAELNCTVEYDKPPVTSEP